MPADIETLHYSDNDSDTHCFIDLDNCQTLYTDDPRDEDINCARCRSEIEADPVGTARQIEKLERAEF